MMVTKETLERGLRLALQRGLDEHELALTAGTEFDIVFDSLVHRWVVELKKILWTQPLTRVTVKYPANWKEAVKERWCPAWVLRRYPVRYIEECLRADQVWPLANVHLDKRFGKSSVFLRTE
ncbi:MAG: hypothetical protein ACREBU_18015 [Nitrososphaera sp.]